MARLSQETLAVLRARLGDRAAARILEESRELPPAKVAARIFAALREHDKRAVDGAAGRVRITTTARTIRKPR